MLKSTRRVFSFWLLWLPTAVLFYAALFLTLRLRYPHGLNHASLLLHLRAFSVIYALWLLVFFIHQMFDFSILRRYAALFFSLVWVTTINLLVATVYFYLQPNLILTPRRFLLLDSILAFALVLAWDLSLKYFLKNIFREQVYIVDEPAHSEELAQEIQSHDYLGFRFSGFLAPAQLTSFEGQADTIFILPPHIITSAELIKIFFALRNFGVRLYSYVDFYELLLRRISLKHLDELWFLENVNYQQKPLYNLTKRLIDLVFSLLGLGLFLISYIPVGALIKLTSPGPIIFAQTRVGKNGQVFQIYKFRTMKTGTVDNTWTKAGDERITSIGRFLRKLRLDELPQFINLFLGNMSLVGPRPEQVGIVEDLKKVIPFYEERHLVKPGVTGWAQLNIYAGNLEETKIKLSYDLYYIKNRSLLFDLEILLKTIYYIFTGQGR